MKNPKTSCPRYLEHLSVDYPRSMRGQDAQLTLTLKRLLLYLAQHLLPAGVTPTYFGELATQAFVSAAAGISKCRNGRVNGSRVAVLTSLRRAEVRRLLTRRDHAEHLDRIRQPRTERVMAAWRTDPRYVKRDGLPRRLPINGRSASFSSLVKAFAGDVPPRAVLEELRRLNAVRETSKGVELIGSGLPKPSVRKSLRDVLEVLVDGLDTATRSSSSKSASVLQRVSLNAADMIDLDLMHERASTGANTFLEGLRRSLEGPTRPPRKTKKTKMKHQLTVTVLVKSHSPTTSSVEHKAYLRHW